MHFGAYFSVALFGMQPNIGDSEGPVAFMTRVERLEKDRE